MKTDTNTRLSRIATGWHTVLEAHGSRADGVADARQRLLLRYHRAIYRYLLGAVRDEDVAEELCHEFAIKLLDGALYRVNPQRGRFRDYVKTTLINLVNAYWRDRGKAARLVNLEATPAANHADTNHVDFDECWRDELLNRGWEALRQFREHYYAVLKLRVENPEMSATSIAERLSTADNQVAAASVRKTLERARGKYADLLVDEVAQAIETADLAEIESELKQLDLLRYCRAALSQRANSENATN